MEVSNIYVDKVDTGKCSLYPQAGRILKMIFTIKKSY